MFGKRQDGSSAATTLGLDGHKEKQESLRLTRPETSSMWAPAQERENQGSVPVFPSSRV